MDVDDALIEAAAAAGVAVFADMPRDITRSMPCVVLDQVGGAGLRPDHHERMGVSSAAFASSRRAAFELAKTTRRAWFAAARAATDTAGGVIGYIAEDLAPMPVPTDLAGVHRSQGTVTVSLRPSR